MNTVEPSFPKMFRVRQRLESKSVSNISATVSQQLTSLHLEHQIKTGDRIAISVGSRGIDAIDRIVRSIVDHLKSLGTHPFIVPAMGSHGGATAEGQAQVLARYGITESSMGCPILSSMDTVVVCHAREGFPVHFDRHAWEADHTLVVNRVKPHTRFTGAIESGLMKMMLIGLGKHAGALVYHQVIMNYSFDQIVRSVAREVIGRCKILAGVAILENADEKTAEIIAVRPDQIETQEPTILERAKQYLPKLPFQHAQLLIVDQIGKNISGSGMDTNVIGRKFSDHAMQGAESPYIHLIYVRGLTQETHGNASGIGIAEICHSRVIQEMDVTATRINCITAGHVTAAMLPLDFPTDRDAIQVALSQAGYLPPADVPVMWIPNTLRLQEIECSEAYWAEAKNHSALEILEPPRNMEFSQQGALRERFT